MSERTTSRADLAGPRPERHLAVESFADFYRRNHRSVLGIVFTLSGSRTASEELTQEAFLRAHRMWKDLDAHANRDAWVKRVAINLTQSWLRRKMVELRVLTRLSRERPTVTAMPEQADHLWEAVRRLPRQQAAAIALRYHDDRSIEDIAEVLECSPNTVGVHLHRGRRTLARQLNLQLEDGPDES